MYLKKYIIIKNKKIAKYLISLKPDGPYSNKVITKDQNKMTYVAVVFYMIWLLLLLFSLIMLFVVPDIPTESIVYELKYGTLILDTFNLKLVSSFTIDFMMLSIAFKLFNRFKVIVKSKGFKILYVVFILLILIGIIANLIITFGLT